MLTAAPAASASVITDWDEIGVKVIQPGPVPPIRPGLLFRAVAMMHLAMFDVVDCIEPRYQTNKIQVEPSPYTSQDAAAASAAGHVLMQIIPKNNVQATLREYLAKIPDGAANDHGVRLGEVVATKIVKTRDKDGSKARNAYRPLTQPGKYVPTAFTVGWETIKMTPFVMTSPSQFRPGPPPDLKSDTWAHDYNEIKELGEKNSTKRSLRQTEDARFWLTTGPLPALHPLDRRIVAAKKLSVVDSARFMAVVSVAEADAIQAVYEVKYTYLFWRPMTAIRNGDIDGNPATERDATWEPIDITPLHPEYPCAHCIVSAAVATVIERMFGATKIPEVVITTSGPITKRPGMGRGPLESPLKAGRSFLKLFIQRDRIIRQEQNAARKPRRSGCLGRWALTLRLFTAFCGEIATWFAPRARKLGSASRSACNSVLQYRPHTQR